MKKVFSVTSVLLLILFLSWLLYVFVSNISQTDSSVKAGLIGLFGIFTAGLITHHQTRKREINARLFIEKREGYKHLMELFFDIILASKRQEQLSEESLVERMITFKRALFFWGEAGTINAWNRFEMNFEKSLSPSEVVQEMEKVMRAIRKDLGHDDSLLPNGQLIALILNPAAKDIALKQTSY